jgi:hypothetical protein
MRFTKNPGRIAGLLYVLASIVGIFGLLYVPSKLIVDGNAVETARNIAASETLFRRRIAAHLTASLSGKECSKNEEVTFCWSIVRTTWNRAAG